MRIFSKDQQNTTHQLVIYHVHHIGNILLYISTCWNEHKNIPRRPRNVFKPHNILQILNIWNRC